MEITLKQGLNLLKRYSSCLTRQQVKTLRGQMLAGNIQAACKGLDSLISGGKRNGEN